MSAESRTPAEALRQQLEDWLQPILIELDAAERARNWPQVERLCKQALQRDGENWNLWQRLVYSHEQRADWVQAETLWRHLTQRFSSRPEPYLALAALQRRRGAPDAARVVLEEAERRVGGGTGALQQALGVIDDPWAMGEAIPQLKAGASAQQVARALQIAQQHLEAGRFSEGEAVLEQILQLKPLAGKVHLNLAQLRRRRDEPDALIAQLEPLLNNPAAGSLPERELLTQLLAEALISRERWQEADALLAPLPTTNPTLALLQAHAAIGMADERRAIGLVRRCLELQPGLAVAEQKLGELLLRQGDAEAAIAALSRAAALDPGDALSLELLQQAREQRLWSRGEQALQRAAWDDAARAYRELIELCGEHRQALARLDLLASLDPSELPALVESTASHSAEARLAAFQRSLDQAESQLKMLGVLG
jgi:tetratricopeptide (TPR) repeat protein